MKDLNEYLPKTGDNLLKLLIATGQDIRVLIIKLADRLHNLRTLGALPPEKQKKIARESLEVFAPLADRLQMGRVRVEIEETSFMYVNPKRYEELKKLTAERLKKADKKLKAAQEAVEQALKKEHIKYKCDGRVKSIYSLHKSSPNTIKTSTAFTILSPFALLSKIPLRVISYSVLFILSSSLWTDASRTTLPCQNKTATNLSIRPSLLMINKS